MRATAKNTLCDCQLDSLLHRDIRHTIENEPVSAFQRTRLWESFLNYPDPMKDQLRGVSSPLLNNIQKQGVDQKKKK